MQDVKRIIEELNEAFPEWKQLLENDSEFMTHAERELRSKVLDLILKLRSYQKENSINLEELTAYVEKKELVDVLMKYVEQTMIHYDACHPIREKSYQDPEKLKELVRDIFENYVLQYDREVYERCTRMSGVEEEKIDEILTSFDTFSEYYVKRLFVQREVVKDLRDETGLSETICEYYAQLYEENFRDLKMNVLMSGIESVQSHMRQMEM